MLSSSSSSAWNSAGQLNELSDLSVTTSGENQANSQKTSDTSDRSLYNSTNPSNLSSLSGLGECHWSSGSNPVDHSPSVQPESIHLSSTNAEVGVDHGCGVPSPAGLGDSVGLGQTQSENASFNSSIPLLPNLSHWWPLLLTTVPSPVSLNFQHAFLYLRFWRHVLAQLSPSTNLPQCTTFDGNETLEPRLVAAGTQSTASASPTSWIASPTAALVPGLSEPVSHSPTQSSPLNLATKTDRLRFDWSPVNDDAHNTSECPVSGGSGRGTARAFSPLIPYDTQWDNRTPNVASIRHSTPRGTSATKSANRSAHMSGTAVRAVYKCSHCGRGFSKAYNRTIHERTHTDERPFGCNVCSRRFRRKDHLRDHSYTHLTSKPFVCNTCNRGFCQSRSLENHKRTNHTNSPSVLGPRLVRCEPIDRTAHTHVIREILQKPVLDIRLGARDSSNPDAQPQAV